MRFPCLCTTLAASCFLHFSPTNAHAQLAPPPQDRVGAIGATPLKAPLTADFSPGTTFTMEGWFYLQFYSRGGWLMGKDLAGSAATTADPFIAFGLYLSPDTGSRLAFSSSNGAPGSYRTVTSPAPLPLNTWVHCAAVMDGAITRLFVNGVVVATGVATGAPPAPASVVFGVGRPFWGDGNSGYGPFPGLARQLRFWNVARTPAQISAATGESLPTDRSGLVAAWPLDESAGTTARDVSGNNRPLIAASGSLSSTSAALLAAGPFFAAVLAPITDGSLNHPNPAGIPIDFDSDGNLDLLVTQGGPATLPETRTRLRAFRFRNGAFVDATDAVLGNVTMSAPTRSIVGDFNGDGRMDVFISDHGTDRPPFPGAQSMLLIQTSDGRLIDETAARIPRHISFTPDCTAADIDGDGDLDIYMANHNGGDAGPRFYINDGRGFFTEATDRLPVDIANRAPGSTYASSNLIDVNGDGRPDLVLGGSVTSQNEILLNDGTGHFARSPRLALPPKLFGNTGGTLTAVSADFNGDGIPDLLFATGGGETVLPLLGTVLGYAIPGLQLLLGRGDGTFTDATATAGFTWSSNELSVIRLDVVDFNGDGRPDFVAQVATAGMPVVRLYLNRGNATFLDVTDTYTRSPVGIVAYAADFNRDGIVDIVTANRTGVTFARGLKSIELGRLANLSVRSQAGTGDQTLITGFALGGGAGTKSLLVRAIGPTLGAFGLTGTLADPFLEIAPLGAAKITENDNWGGTTVLKSAFNSVGAFALSPDTSKDAALVFSPSAGAYTAKVTGANNGTGLALVELYDAGTGNTPRLTNVSARTQVGTGGDALIAGFVVNGTLPKKLLIRAAGPALAAFGVGGTLVDPVLTVRPLGVDAIVATNDDWGGTAALKAAFASVGAFGFAVDASKDAAIAIELPPGAYTATVTGKNNTTGVALVEVYELP